MAVAHHLLLAASAAALTLGAVRLVSPLAPRGLERAIAAAPVACALAISWALLLGLGELGTNAAALAVAAGVTWAGIRLGLPAPSVPLSQDLAEWWAGRPLPWRAAAGAAAGALAAYAGFLLRHPQLGGDSVIYHLPDLVAWIGNGRPASSVDLLYALPVGNYPQANETLLTWGGAVSRSFVFPGLWSLGMLVVLVAAAWLALRRLAVPRPLAAVGIAALCTGPLVVDAVHTAGTDLPSVTWLVVTAALLLCARERPGLLAPALVAAGLGIGTKTTVAPLLLVLLGWAFWTQRAQIAPHRRPLILAALGALVVGGTWYVRNLIGHGSPLWPLIELPGSDPVPDLVDRLDYSLLDRPDRTLSGNLDVYERRLAGYLLLLAAALLAPLVMRRRVVVVVAAATALSVLLWLNAPFTGAGDSALERPFLSTVRYLMPAVAAAIGCLVLAGTHGGKPGRLLVGGALVLAMAWNLFHTLDLGFPFTPSLGTLLAGAALGAIAGAALAYVPNPSPALLRVGCVPALVAVAAVGAAATDGYVERHARANAGLTTPFASVLGPVAGRPDFQDGSDRVSMAPGVSAMFAGDTLDHDVVLIPKDEPCDRVEARAQEGWVVIADLVADSVPAYTARTCFSGTEPLFESGPYRVYRTGR